MSRLQWGGGWSPDGQSGGTDPFYPCPICGMDMGHGAGLGLCSVCLMKRPRPVDPRDAELTALRAERDALIAKLSMWKMADGDEHRARVAEAARAVAESERDQAQGRVSALIKENAQSISRAYRSEAERDAALGKLHHAGMQSGKRILELDALVERLYGALCKIAMLAPGSRTIETAEMIASKAIEDHRTAIAPVAGQRGEGTNQHMGSSLDAEHMAQTGEMRTLDGDVL